MRQGLGPKGRALFCGWGRWTPHYVAKLWRHRRTLEELLDPGQPLPVLPLFQPSRYLALPLMSIMRVARWSPRPLCPATTPPAERPRPGRKEPPPKAAARCHAALLHLRSVPLICTWGLHRWLRVTCKCVWLGVPMCLVAWGAGRMASTGA